MWVSSPEHFVGNERNDYEKTNNRTVAFSTLYTVGTTIEQGIASPGIDCLWEAPNEGHWCTKNEDGFGGTEREHRLVDGGCTDL